MKFLFLMSILFINSIWEGNSPFSRVRVLERDKTTGRPLKETIDVTICLQRNVDFTNPSSKDGSAIYEKIIKIWADGIYEMSNGVNFLGKVRIFDGGKYQIKSLSF